MPRLTPALTLALLLVAGTARGAYPVFEGHQTHPLEITDAACTRLWGVLLLGAALPLAAAYRRRRA